MGRLFVVLLLALTLYAHPELLDRLRMGGLSILQCVKASKHLPALELLKPGNGTGDQGEQYDGGFVWEPGPGGPRKTIFRVVRPGQILGQVYHPGMDELADLQTHVCEQCECEADNGRCFSCRRVAMRFCKRAKREEL